ncbi:MAG: PHP domain-containing protein, partial [Tepidimonas sp.]|uniref:PHP domain-containing protein n=1 Tax=Tepidimonas sp. TaxID=2002775 RepID=UPI0040550A76
MFVHLRLHTEFSVVDGTTRIHDAVERAAADGQPALAITDLNNLFGGIKFYKAARAAGVKPVLGAEINLLGLEGEARAALSSAGPALVPQRVLLLVQNHRGYLNLCELLTRAWTQGVVRDQAFVRWAWLQELADGLILLSGAAAGPVGQALLAGDETRATQCALRL